MITETKFENGSPAEVVLHPLMHNQLTSDTSLPDRTMPKVAPAAEAQRILAHLQKASKLFGTEIVVKDNVGHIKII
jgi:poly-gamma-glutamate synthesis protein (capsule biosynthesis protein)